MPDFFESEFDRKIAKTIACIRGDPAIKAMFKREAAARFEKAQLEGLRLGWKGLERRLNRVPVEKKTRAPIREKGVDMRRVEAFLAKHRAKMAAREVERQRQIEAKRIATERRKALRPIRLPLPPKPPCECERVSDHFIKCHGSIWTFFEKKRRMIAKKAA